ncbi:LPS export ABC transporter permease LptF [Malikia sp.]|uniref:LPS export ABC transporter permease LptF n=1 Tax=Malikia sp. TaxID=2070706 RepID=UPI0026108B34|nr:LPS export ABC transporter permease LptF [Malikia sp.]MDD2730422.1 LPS export ABC transporter permease LptF [Malikia sp.]
MLFHSSIRRELARSFGANLLVLFTIVLTMLLIRTLGLASKGSVNPQEILLVLTYTVMAQMPIVLTIALFVAIVSTLSRMYADSEMFIWFAAGRGLAGFLPPVLRFAWPVLAAVALLVAFAWPWANEQTELLRIRYEQRGDLERVSPGQFMESSGGRRVFFIDRDTSGGKEGRNVFIADTGPDGRETITSAQAGRIEWMGPDQYLMLDRGQRLELPPPEQADGAIRVSEFESYGIRIGGMGSARGQAEKLKAQPTLELLRHPTRAAMGELSWRIGMAITAFNFVLIAVAVSVSNPRAGRSGNLIFLLFSFVLYYNLVNLGAGWIAAGKFNWLAYMVTVHCGVLAATLAWLAKRHYNWRLWPQRRAAALEVPA